MTASLTDNLTAEHRRSFDEILDVRSPSEFAEDHIPGARNLPVLSDAERAEVGTLYKANPFAARKLGAALVSRSIAGHLQAHLADKSGGYRPLIYCWRGGMRSQSLGTVLTAIGWRVTLINGGYQTYREWVRQQLTTLGHGLTFRIIAGPTGSGKTRLLQHLASCGEQVLDLEGLANHRGSAIGHEPHSPQPSQRWLESQLVAACQAFEPARVVWVEAESRRIGNLFVPPALWAQMRGSPGVELVVPMAERVRFLLSEYAHFVGEPGDFEPRLVQLGGRHNSRLSHWKSLLAAGEWATLVQSLLEDHYDPRYQHALQTHFPNVTARCDLPGLQAVSLAECVHRICRPALDESPRC